MEKESEVILFSSIVTLHQLADKPLETTEKAHLKNLEMLLLDNFKKEGYATKAWVSEIVGLAVTNNKTLYQNVLGTYLLFLRDAPLLESYHLQGFADLLHLSAQNDWLDSSQIDQIFAVLQNKEVLFQNKNLTLVDLCHRIKLWKEICYAIEDTQVELKEATTKQISALFETYKKRCKKLGYEDGKYLLDIAEQSLLRIKNDAPHPGFKAAGYLGSAVLNLGDAAISSGIATMTFGASSFSAVRPTLNALQDIAKAGIVLFKAAKKEFSKEKWHKILREIEASCWLCVMHKEEALFVQFGEELKKFTETDYKIILAHELIDVLAQIALTHRGEEYKKYHEVIFNVLSHYFSSIPDVTLRARIMDIFMHLAKVTGNATFYEAIFQLMSSFADECAEFPFTLEHAEHIVALFAGCEHILHDKNETKKHQTAKIVQGGLIHRLEKQFNHTPDLVIEIILKLRKEIKNQRQIVDLEALGVSSSKIKEVLQRLARIEKTSQAPLLLITWYQLPEEARANLIHACQKHKLFLAPIINKQELPCSTLFGEVGKMAIGLLIDRGALHINYPNFKNPDDYAKFFNSLDKEKLKTYADSQQGDKDKAKPQQTLAAKVGVLFIADYVQGVQVGVPTEIVEEAIKLAREWGQEEDKKQKEVDSTKQAGVIVTNSPIYHSNPEWVFLESGENNTFVIRIDYKALHKLDKKKPVSIQEELLTISKENFAYVSNKTNDRGWITELHLNDKEAAEEVLSQFKNDLLQLSSQPVSEALSNGKK